MKIGILGSGRMGRALGESVAKKGHEIFVGSRTPERLASEAGFSGRTGSYADAAAFGDIVLLVVRWADVETTIAAAGSLRGKIVIDCTNPEAPDARSLVLGHTTSGSEQISQWAPGAKIVKAFNHVYAHLLQSGAQFGSESASAFYCGDDEGAKKTVAGLISELGFDAVDSGPLKIARYLEPLAQLMVQLVRVMNLGPANVAIKLLHRRIEE